jgi:integration host factor subunit alpha
MTKADIVDKLYDALKESPKSKCYEYVDLVFDMMKQTLAQGEEVKISRFGKFSVRNKKERQGRNPKTGEPVTISRRRVVTFQVSPMLREAVNKDQQ